MDKIDTNFPEDIIIETIDDSDSSSDSSSSEESHSPKKPKAAPVELDSSPFASKLFRPFKAVGYICNHVPISIQFLGQAAFYAACTGNSFQIFENDKLNVILVSKPTIKPINALTTKREQTFVAAGNQIIVYQRSEPVETFTSNFPGDITYLEIFGGHLMALTEDNVFQLWDYTQKELYTDIQFQQDSFRISCLVHPATYLNKIVFGSTQGAMQLWNIKTRKPIYHFKSFGSPITCLVQSPAVDVLAVGLLDGRVILHNIKQDKTLFTVKQQTKVTAITFRTDAQPHMATASMDGDIHVWDLDSRKLLNVLQKAHSGAISTLQFLNNQNLLISSGVDNALKQWLFETDSHSPRLLKSREGHSAPPTQIQHFIGGSVLSAGQDRTLRRFALIKDSHSIELSQGNIVSRAKATGIPVEALRLPPVTQMASSSAQLHRFDSLLTVHLGKKEVVTWSVSRGALGSHLLTPPKGAVPKAVAISHCGHYGLVGTTDGAVHLFNLQSGLLRRSSSSNLHTRPITAVLTDDANRHFVTTSLDGFVKIWDFANFQLTGSIELPAAAAYAVRHHDTSLIAVACDDTIIRVVDIETYKIVRVFKGHSHRLTSLIFSADGRWLISSSLDGTVRTWDMPSGHLVDAFRVDSVVTSLSFSSGGNFLATSHADRLGVYMWSNRSIYSEITLKSLPNDFVPRLTTLPEQTPDQNDEVDSNNGSDSEDESIDESKVATLYRDPDQLAEEMVTLSHAPWSKWQKLLHLSTIKQRNKPIAPPRKPEKLPFFLATTQGLNPMFVAPEVKKDDTVATHFIDSSNHIESEFISVLAQSLAADNPEPILQVMEGLTPPQIEVEISLLSVRDDFAQFRTFLAAIALLLTRGVGFEMAHVYLQTFLKTHGEIIAANPESFREPLLHLESIHKPQWGRLSTLLMSTSSLIDFIRTK